MWTSLLSFTEYENVERAVKIPPWPSDYTQLHQKARRLILMLDALDGLVPYTRDSYDDLYDWIIHAKSLGLIFDDELEDLSCLIAWLYSTNEPLSNFMN